MKSYTKFIVLYGFLAISPITSFAQNTQVSYQQYVSAVADLAIQTNNIANDNSNISACNVKIAQDNTVIASWNAANAQNVSAWNFDYDAQLEAGGCRWATCFPVVFPNANLTAIATQINITCPVAETAVNWPNWPNCEANGVQGNVSIGTYSFGWQAFYCGQGSVSGKC